MALTIEKLAQLIQSFQSFVGNRVSQDPIYRNIEQSLNELNETLKTGELKLSIVGQNVAQAQALQQLLMLNSKLQDSYQIKSFSLPEFSNFKALSPTLVFQSDGIQSPISYELKSSDSQVIGRNPTTAKLLIPDQLSLVGGSHAEIRCIEGVWQIRDLGSRNGTFVNGNAQKLQDWYRLKRGDRICLGSVVQSPDSATLVFEAPSEEAIALAQLEAQKRWNCNVLCVVIPVPFSQESVQPLLQVAQETQAAKIFFLVDKPGNVAPEILDEALSSTQELIKAQFKDTSPEIIPLLLKPYTPGSGATIITPQAQPEFESFCESLNLLSKEKTETILAEWATVKLNHLVNQIESLLVQQVSSLEEKLQSDQAKFKELSQGSFKKQAEKIYKKVDSERDQFFRQAKAELSQSKAALLDEHRQSSLPYKLQQFAKQLQPQVHDQGGYRYVRLSLRDSDKSSRLTNVVHTAATELCHHELTRWAAAEWSRLQTEYSDGGLKALLEKSYQSLNFASALNLPKDKFSVTQTLNIQSVLNVSNVEPTLEMRYKQIGFWGYVSKTLRTNMMTIIGTTTMLSGGLFAAQKQNFIWTLIPLMFAFALLGYRHEKQTKIEEVAERLQKEAIAYYQSYVKGLIDRIAQRIGGLLESEERNFREALEDVKEIYTSYQSELDKMQNELKARLAGTKSPEQNKLEKDLVELRKLKQTIAL